MKDLLVQLFYTVDSQTGQTRTTDHWVQTPTHWIRVVYQERDDLIHSDLTIVVSRCSYVR